MKRSTDSPDMVSGAISPKRRRPTAPKEFNNKDVAPKSGCIDNGDTISSHHSSGAKKKANVRKERNESVESTISMTTFIENNLSEKAKYALLRLEKSKTQDPFNEENQMLLTEFTTQVTQQQTEQDVSLAEAGVLLDGVGQVYSRQVKRLHSDVLALAAFCATTPKPKPKEVNKDNVAVKDPNQTEGMETTDMIAAPEGDGSVPDVDGNGSLNAESLKVNEPGTEGSSEVPPANGTSSENGTQDGPLASAASDALPETHVPTEEEQNLFLQSLVLDGATSSINMDGDSQKISEDFNSGNLVTSTPTKENHVRVGPSAGTRGAEKCYSIKDLLQDQSFFRALGMVLNAKGEPKVGNSRVKVPKLVPFYKIPFVDAGDLGPPRLESSILSDLPDIQVRNEIITDINKNYVFNRMATPEPQLSLPSMVPEGVAYQASKVKEDSLIKPEDLTSIHKFIQQLHYLSLNTEVSAERKEGLFKNAVDQLQKIFETYNVTQPGAPASSENDASQANGTEEETSEVTQTSVPSSNADIRTSTDSLPESDQNHLLEQNKCESQASTPCPASRKSSTEEEDGDLHLDLESMHESFSESCDDNSTVMQRTKEKSRKESRHRLQEVLSTILSPIVKKHSIKPLMEEHSEAFFRKVESFQSKMKKILEEEKRKDQFNLTTYEQELLEVANKDMDSDDGSQVPNPVSNKLNDSHELDAKDFAEPQSPCRSETSSNSNGLKWIKLENLFAHVKHQDKGEAARYFCAVLGLLSFENFDVNYDKLYDEASAKRVKKSLDLTQDQKYPRGAKIVKSRCPDVNEVFVTALSSVSRTETFRQKEYGLSPEDIKKMHQAEFLEATGAQAAFEQVQGEIYTGELFSKRSRAMQARKLLKAQLQADKDQDTPPK